jgi:hypothetical protein
VDPECLEAGQEINCASASPPRGVEQVVRLGMLAAGERIEAEAGADGEDGLLRSTSPRVSRVSASSAGLAAKAKRLQMGGA